MAKIAYLVLAHENPKHLRRLLAALASDAAACFVHLDAKARAQDFAQSAGPRVHFTQKRVRVYWGDFSIVEATLVLLREALAHPARFDRCVLLSGADHPLRSAASIESFFEHQRETEFMQLIAMPCEAQGKPIARLTVYQHRPEATRLTRQLRRSLITLGVVSKRRDLRTALRGLTPYAGSQWWALTREACEHLLDFAARERWLARFFAHTHCPDESFFHTVLGNSRFAPRMRPALTFADWIAGGTSPASISEAHVARFEAEAALHSDDAPGAHEWLFARKLDDASEALVARLERLRSD